LVLPEFEVISDHADFLNEEFPSKKVIRDFSLLSRAKYLVLSNSSFSWWGAWVNKNPTIVIAPKYWARHNLRTSMWSTGDILTKGWRYLDSFGALYDYEDCILENQTIKQTFKRKVRSRKNYNWWK
jgi:hypothetical protein